MNTGEGGTCHRSTEKILGTLWSVEMEAEHSTRIQNILVRPEWVPPLLLLRQGEPGLGGPLMFTGS